MEDTTMAMTIYTNMFSVDAQTNLAKNRTMLSTSIQRLSSGLRINTAKDDAAGLAVSNLMNANIRSMGQASRNANDGIGFLNTADGALGSQGDILTRMRELATQSATGTLNDQQRATINVEFSSLKNEMDRIASTTQFAGVNLLDGTMSAATAGVQVANLPGSFSVANNGTIKGMDVGATANTTGYNGSITVSKYNSTDPTAGAAVAGVSTVSNGAITAVAGGKITGDTANVGSLTLNSTLGANAITTNGAVTQAGGNATAISLTANQYATVNTSAGVATITNTGTGTITLNLQAGTSALTNGTGATGDVNNTISGGILTNIKTGTNAVTDNATIQGTLQTNVAVGSLTAAGGLTVSGATVNSAALYVPKQTGALAGVSGGQFLSTFGGAAQTFSGALNLVNATESFSGTNTNINGGTITQVGSGQFSSGAVAGNTATMNLNATNGQGPNAMTINGANTSVSAASGVVTVTLAASTATSVNSVTFNSGNGNPTTITALNTGFSGSTSINIAGGTILTDANGKQTVSGGTITSVTANADQAGHVSTVDISGAIATNVANIGTGINTGAASNIVDPINPNKTTGGVSLQIGIGATSADRINMNTSINLTAQNTTALGLSSVDVSTALGAQSALGIIDSAISSNSSQRGAIGAMQNRMQFAINNIATYQQNITAAKSQITDADYATEVSGFTRNQILVQASTAILAQANQIPQGVLQLLG
jgi:flagellin